VLALLASEPQIRRAERHASKAAVTLGRHATCTGLHRIAMPLRPKYRRTKLLHPV
jgi:hypothetical protein